MTADEITRREIQREWLGAQPGFDQRDAPNPEDVEPMCRPADRKAT